MTALRMSKDTEVPELDLTGPANKEIDEFARQLQDKDSPSNCRTRSRSIDEPGYEPAPYGSFMDDTEEDSAQEFAMQPATFLSFAMHRKAGIETNATVSCPRGHRMSVSDFADGDYLEGWRCSSCFTSGTGKRFFCRACSYDYCPSCAKSVASPQAGEGASTISPRNISADDTMYCGSAPTPLMSAPSPSSLRKTLRLALNATQASGFCAPRALESVISALEKEIEPSADNTTFCTQVCDAIRADEAENGGEVVEGLLTGKMNGQTAVLQLLANIRHDDTDTCISTSPAR
jgi:hypothetical protein